MELIAQGRENSTPVIRKAVSAFRVLQVNDIPFLGDVEDDLRERICICQAPLRWAIRQIWTNYKQIDAVIIGPKYSLSDIISIREVAGRKVVPIILHTLKFEWKANEIARATGVDEYHTGPLDGSFIRRIEAIKKVKSYGMFKAGSHYEGYEGALQLKYGC